MHKIDHLVYAASDLAAGVEKIYRTLGVQPGVGGRHPQWGTRNELLALGPDIYLEIIGPDPERAVEPPAWIFGINQLAEPRLITWAAKAQPLEQVLERAVQHGISLGDILSGSRQKPDGSMLSWRLTDPFAMRGDGLIPFWIDWGASSSHPAASAAGGCTLLSLRAEHPEPDEFSAMTRVFELDLPVSYGPRAQLIAVLATPLGEVELR